METEPIHFPQGLLDVETETIHFHLNRTDVETETIHFQDERVDVETDITPDPSCSREANGDFDDLRKFMGDTVAHIA